MSSDAILGRIERVAERCGVSITAGLDRSERYWAVTVICRAGDKPSLTVMEPTLGCALDRAVAEAASKGWVETG